MLHLVWYLAIDGEDSKLFRWRQVLKLVSFFLSAYYSITFLSVAFTYWICTISVHGSRALYADTQLLPLHAICVSSWIKFTPRRENHTECGVCTAMLHGQHADRGNMLLRFIFLGFSGNVVIFVKKIIWFAVELRVHNASLAISCRARLFVFWES